MLSTWIRQTFFDFLLQILRDIEQISKDSGSFALNKGHVIDLCTRNFFISGLHQIKMKPTSLMNYDVMFETNRQTNLWGKNNTFLVIRCSGRNIQEAD